MNSSEFRIWVNRQNRRKRITDSVLILVTAPFWLPIAAATAVIVRLALGRPIIFRQTRIGLEEREFTLYKCRSMINGTKEVSDRARLTSVGAKLRALSLDEIPQLWNVLRGEMALVGPRPLYSEYLPVYTERERLRHAVRPGITGLAQTSGRNSLVWETRLEADVRYVEELSAQLDLKILVRTFLQVLKRSDISVIASETGEPLHIHRSYPVTTEFGLRRFSSIDIPTRVSWMQSAELQRYMRLPEVPNDRDTHAWFINALSDPSRLDLTLYSNVDQAPVAMLGLKYTDEHDLPEMYLFVAPDRQGEGVGRKALELLYRWLSSSESHAGCYLKVQANNTRAVKLYENFGFRIIQQTFERVYMSLSVDEWRQHAAS